MGRQGVAELGSRCCRYAMQFPALLDEDPEAEVLNDVVLNHALVRVGDDERSRAVAAAVQREGTVWLGTTAWRGVTALRISVSDAATATEDIEVAGAASAG